MFIRKKLHQNPFLLSLLSGVLLFAAWPMSPFTFLIFIAFIPLLVLSELSLSRSKYFLCIYLAMLIWNISTTWWIWYASPEGATGAFLANSLLMCIPWLLYRRVKRVLSSFVALIALLSFWMVFEFLHLQDWGLSWPWLTIGNVFAAQRNWIQWYEFTGVSGGTLWVLLVNAIVFWFVQKARKQKYYYYKYGTGILLLLLVPVLYSYLLKSFLGLNNIMAKKAKHFSVAICQPNIDAYAKISGESFSTQLNTLISTSKNVVDSTTSLLVWPETALYNEYRFNEEDINGNHQLDTLFTFLQQYPKLQLFTGIESYRYFTQPTPDSRTFPNTSIHFESYNSSVLLNASGPKMYYHKSQLVPGVETLPPFLKILGAWFEKFGGTTNGYVKSLERTVINTAQDSTQVEKRRSLQLAPSICYESIYGAFMSEYVKRGANLITIITNDGWWKNTPGHQQHMNYARLRAIENRTWVARSANTGISCFIGPDGAVYQPQPYDTKAAIKMDIPLTHSATFYTRHPDLLYKIFYFVAMLLLLVFIVKSIQIKK